jgi:RNA recognition motif-containing protein
LKNIYVGNLSFGASEESVRALFDTHSTVDRVNIVTGADTGQPRGFGFVEMANDGEGEKAIAVVNGMDLHGRSLNVNEALPKCGSFKRRWQQQTQTLVAGLVLGPIRINARFGAVPGERRGRPED